MFVSPPDDLYVSRTGEIRCINHMPSVGSFGWTFGSWRLLSEGERTTPSGQPVECPQCRAGRRHEGHGRFPR